MKTNNFGMATLGPEDDIDVFIDESDWFTDEMEAKLVDDDGADIFDLGSGDLLFRLRGFDNQIQLGDTLADLGIGIA